MQRNLSVDIEVKGIPKPVTINFQASKTGENRANGSLDVDIRSVMYNGVNILPIIEELSLDDIIKKADVAAHDEIYSSFPNL